VPSFFPRYCSFKKGSITNKEFLQALDSLDALLLPEPTILSYYDNLVSRQSLGYPEPLLLLD
jgi:hypothetical protein